MWVNECPKHGVIDEEKLVGAGNPPSCPECQKENPGAGQFPLAKTWKEEAPQ